MGRGGRRGRQPFSPQLPAPLTSAWAKMARPAPPRKPTGVVQAAEDPEQEGGEGLGPEVKPPKRTWRKMSLPRFCRSRTIP